MESHVGDGIVSGLVVALVVGLVTWIDHRARSWAEEFHTRMDRQDADHERLSKVVTRLRLGQARIEGRLGLPPLPGDNLEDDDDDEPASSHVG
jgi:hypothetical protein